MLDPQKIAFIEACEMVHGVNAIVSRSEINDLVSSTKLGCPYWLMTSEYATKTRGIWKVPSTKVEDLIETNEVSDTARAELDSLATLFQVSASNAVPASPKAPIDMLDTTLHSDSKLIPDIFQGYVPFGFFGKLKQIIESRKFFPVFVTGDSGEGKTLMVQQVCAILGRECILASISIETDQNDLLGGPTLLNGNVVEREGLVITAMKRGAVLLLDEVDRGCSKLICLHSILDGQPHFNKNTGELIYPAPGFTVVATANTKGRGDDHGKYLSQIMDNAFLERFPVTIEQENPPASLQTQILKTVLNRVGRDDDEFATNLVRWASVIRTSYKDEGTIDEQISTRRLVQICETFGIFADKTLSINLCINRFDGIVKTAFADFYKMVDEKSVKEVT